ncbi:hypothetical protein F3Y22_tig00110007pilonHSYRG00083 [Hibiscus syriacus]|uniref:RNase H type-1 domain-containing protein n=1 Tax=Hibiscus syriacus TaxID=106335 RepID=A0A6A3BRH3_HIBSY|nr:hypothetical protein F3Y22_tig00110007pilonHSYRG00083 [Hibiscus syriacus]
MGFSKFLGIFSVLEAEIWCVYCGLLCAWDMSSRHIIIETDSLETIKVVKQARDDAFRFTVLHSVEALLQRNWVVRFQHIPRQGNRITDCMAKIADRRSMECIHFVESPELVRQLLQEDQHSYNV